MEPHETFIPRPEAAAQGQQALRIINEGRYRTSNGQTVHIQQEIRHAVDHTHTYRPNEDPPFPTTETPPTPTTITVQNTTTLQAARQLHAANHNPVSLNFASATHPGGGFLRGARAQEEYLCRSTALYAGLQHQPMYADERQRHDPLYRDWVIYSPNVPVFRQDDGQLEEHPWQTSFITSPAPNAGALPRDRHDELTPALRERVHKVLATGLAHGHDAIVLGAWGCGAFRNDPHDVATIFKEALHGPFKNHYRAVTFAVLDGSKRQRNISPFERAFAR